MFNTFFYTRYKQGYDNFKNSDRDTGKAALTAKTQRTKSAYDGVRRWWKGIDLFTKDFLVVPINLHLHWSLMIICHPGTFKTFLDYELDFALREEKEKSQQAEQKREKKKNRGKKIQTDHIPEEDYEEKIKTCPMEGLSFRGVSFGDIACCFGMLPLWEGVYEAWLLPCKDLTKNKFKFHRASLKFFEYVAKRLNIHRLQINVSSQNCLDMFRF